MLSQKIQDEVIHHHGTHGVGAKQDDSRMLSRWMFAEVCKLNIEGQKHAAILIRHSSDFNIRHPEEFFIGYRMRIVAEPSDS